MLNIDSLETGIVIDHIKAGASMRVYKLLKLDKLDCCVAVIKNARSSKYGRKDIIKIEGITDINLDVLGFIDHKITVDIIREGKIVEKKKAGSSRRAEKRGALQKSPVHYQHRTESGSGVPPVREQRNPSLSLHLL